MDNKKPLSLKHCPTLYLFHVFYYFFIGQWSSKIIPFEQKCSVRFASFLNKKTPVDENGLKK